MTEDDEIIAEIRRRREAHAAAFNHDIDRIVQDLQRQEADSTEPVVNRPSREPLPPRGRTSA